jgi:hypothetical protein
MASSRLRLVVFPLGALTLLACPSTTPEPGAAANDAAKPSGAPATVEGETPSPDASTPSSAGAGDRKADVASKQAAAKAKLAGRSEAEVLAAKTKMIAALNEGRQLVADGKLIEGIAKYEELLAIDPQYGPALGEIGWAEFKSEHYDAAESYTLRALARAPDDKRRGMFHYNLGRIAEARGQTEAAIHAYALSLEFRPNETVAGRLAEIATVVDAGGTAYEHSAVAEYEAKFGDDAKPRPGILEVLASGLPTATDACKLAGEDCFDSEDCTFSPHLPGSDETWGVLEVGNAGIVACWQPIMQLDDGWTVFSIALVGQYGSAVNQSVDSIATRIVTNAAGSFLFIDYADHVYAHGWDWDELEEDDLPEYSSIETEGVIICRRGAPVTCTAPIPTKYLAEQGPSYEASVTLDGDVIVIDELSSQGGVEYGMRESEWDQALPLPEGRYALADLR